MEGLPEIVQQWMVGIVLVLLVAGLVRDVWRPSMLFFLALLVLTTVGAISPEDMMSGFANTQIATVVLLLIIGNVINQTTIIPALFDRLFKYSRTYRKFLNQMMLTVGTSSSFMNNTPLVAMLIPYVYNWGKKNGVSPSKLLIPLSYATIAGGMITVIGTSTNLIVNGLMESDGLQPFPLFAYAPIGIVVMLVVWLYMTLVGSKLLPDNTDPIQVVRDESKPFIVEVLIEESSPLVGKTIEEASAFQLKGLFVVAILEENEVTTPVEPERVLHAGARLVVKGSKELVAKMLSGEMGVHLPQVKRFDPGADLKIVEIAVSYNSSLSHKQVRNTKFRSIYGGSILAIHRPDENILTRVDEVVINPGDVLMVIAGKDALKKFRETTDFYVISEESPEQRIGGWKAWAVGGSFLFILLLNTIGWANLFTLCLWLGGFYYLLRVTNFRSVQRTLDIDLILVLALSIGLGKAIKNTGLAEVAAAAMNEWFGQFGVVGALVGVYLLANVLTQLISNAASATIAYPIAVATAQVLEADISAFIMTVAFAASLDFSTPIGYQTNLMVYGPGGYKFTDYMRVGIPLNLGLLVLVVGMICWVYGLI
jgi:di/tricarboxylate transporter